MGLYAVIKGDVVDGIAIADDPLDTDGKWICIDDLAIKPAREWKYNGVSFEPPLVAPPPPPPEIIIPKTEEQKIADATAAAIAKLIADGVLKQA